MPPAAPRGPRPSHHADFDADLLVAAKAGRRVTVCLPARDEEPTVGAVVAAIRRELVEHRRLVDEVLVVDDRSSDGTAAVARRAGARVVAGGGHGKGAAMATGLAASDGDLVVFCDADVPGFPAHFVVGLLGPLVLDGGVVFAKARYERPLHGRPGEGGRVTELVAKPLLRTLFPALAGFAQPLAGECAAPREVLEQVPFVLDYGVDVGLLIDVAERHGVAAMAEVDLGRRVHRNRPLAQLSPQAESVVRTVLHRAGVAAPVPERPPLAGPPAERRSA